MNRPIVIRYYAGGEPVEKCCADEYEAVCLTSYLDAHGYRYERVKPRAKIKSQS